MVHEWCIRYNINYFIKYVFYLQRSYSGSIHTYEKERQRKGVWCTCNVVWKWTIEEMVSYFFTVFCCSLAILGNTYVMCQIGSQSWYSNQGTKESLSANSYRHHERWVSTLCALEKSFPLFTLHLGKLIKSCYVYGCFHLKICWSICVNYNKDSFVPEEGVRLILWSSKLQTLHFLTSQWN